MADILEYKCPCCGGAIRFDSDSQKMKCPYCDTEFELDTLKQFDEENIEEDRDPGWDGDSVAQSSDELDGEQEGLVTYVCESCGGQIVADRSMAASSCPYCGNSVIVTKQLSGMLRPDFVIPFKLDKKTAENRLKDHFKGKVLLPKLFRNENRIKEIKGIYVPFWLYDCDAQADIRCRATRISSWQQGDYMYTETQHYLVARSGDIGFDRVPADGSLKLDDALMDSLEPYDYSEAVDFQTAYLAGYFADKYDQSAQDCAPRANRRVRESTQNAFMATIAGYATCVPEHMSIQLKQGRIRYALLPVWLLNTVYKGQTYTFAMNGQTGKFIGNLPVDKGRAFAVAGGVFAAATLLSWLLMCFLL